MNPLKIMVELSKLVTIINEADMAPEVRKDLKKIIIRLNEVIIDGVQKEYDDAMNRKRATFDNVVDKVDKIEYIIRYTEIYDILWYLRL